MNNCVASFSVSQGESPCFSLEKTLPTPAQARWGVVRRFLKRMSSENAGPGSPLYLRDKYWILLAFSQGHVPLARYARKLMKEWQSSLESLSFQDFLEKQGMKEPCNEREILLSPLEKQRYRCAVHKCEDRSCQILGADGNSLEEGTYLYVLEMDGSLYAGKETEENREGIIWYFKHMSLSSGRAVATAGEISINQDGKLVETVPKSGHYRPQEEHAKRFPEWLEAQGIDLSTIVIHPVPKKDASN